MISAVSRSHQVIFCFLLILCLVQSEGEKKLGEEIENFDTTQDGEAGEEPHVAADEGDEGGKRDLHVPLHDVVSGRADVEVDNLQGIEIFVLTCTVRKDYSKVVLGVGNCYLRQKLSISALSNSLFLTMCRLQFSYSRRSRFSHSWFERRVTFNN